MKKKIALSLIMILVVMAAMTGCGGGSGGDTGGGTGGGGGEKVNWKLASTWADGTFLFSVDQRFCELVGELTDGNFTIKPYGVGQLGAANQVFDLVQGGTVEAGGDWPSYWTGKSLGFDLLATTMFDFTNWDYYVWIYEGGGLEDAYNYMFNQFGMVYFPTAVTPMESGIRSNVPIKSLADFKGLKIRFAGKIQGMVAEKIGITPVTIAADELYESLQRGVIDAAEYSGPYNDDVMKIQEVTKYWLTPGWHQTASAYGAMINQAAYDKLPDAYKDAIEKAAKLTMVEYMAKYTWNDAQATQRILDAGVETTTLSDEDMATLQQYTLESAEALAAESEDYAHVYKSMLNYRKTMENYRTALGDWGFGINLKEYPNIPE
ncbi:TRAP transporter substrate-binding protein [Bacilliculturomica massiliensis]|uniref:TRAP transporter substrate-binding protein n=1 Tax=Bacilliculturomica massiliensis TaxID=1917867 RepID=UPI0010325D11|nr:TRAP transporter substrate-binding protein DctP [Bacilliculturomica massiliensis]